MEKAGPDVEASAALDGGVVWLHRTLPDADIYYRGEPAGFGAEVEARFRVSGREPEIWYPASGAVDEAGFAIADGRTTVPLHLEERESCLCCVLMPLLRRS